MAQPPAAPLLTSTCHLLRLPSELRNAIYAYVLSTQNGLTYHSSHEGVEYLCNGDFSMLVNRERWTRNRYHSAPNFQEANQMKFVSRQLYAETRGHILRYNTIVFEGFKQLAAFLHNCPAVHYLRFQTLIVREAMFRHTQLHYITDPRATEEVFHFCRQNPQVTIRNTTLIKVSSYTFLFQAMKLEVLTRKSLELMYQVISDRETQDRSIRQILGKYNVESVERIPGNTPLNFRMFPQLIGDEEESLQIFQNACLAAPVAMDFLLPMVDGGLERWFNLTKKILRQGI